MRPLLTLLAAAQVSVAWASYLGPGRYSISVGDSLSISSPGYPSPYSGKMRRRWRFTPTSDDVIIEATCTNVDLTDSKGCQRDKLVFKNPLRHANYPRRNLKIDKICGNHTTYSYNTDADGQRRALQIDFKSSPQGAGGDGFECTIEGKVCIEDSILYESECMTISCKNQLNYPAIKSNCTPCAGSQGSLLQFDALANQANVITSSLTYTYTQNGLSSSPDRYVDVEYQTFNGVLRPVAFVLQDVGDSTVSCAMDGAGVTGCDGHGPLNTTFAELTPGGVIGTEVAFTTLVKYYVVISADFTVWIGNMFLPMIQVIVKDGGIPGLAGICGNNNGNATDDLTLHDGTQAADIFALLADWTV